MISAPSQNVNMNASFGSHITPQPQFGANNKFLGNTGQTQIKSLFDPNAASFGFNSGNKQSFNNIKANDSNFLQTS